MGFVDPWALVSRRLNLALVWNTEAETSGTAYSNQQQILSHLIVLASIHQTYTRGGKRI
jgi:hypothetical protein